VDQISGDPVVLQSEGRNIESAMKTLWEKARRAGEHIAALKEDNADLRSRLEDVQAQLEHLNEELVQRDQTISQLEAEQAEADSKREEVFSNGEREALAAKVKDLLARIDTYL
jgi:chromosome segregation ATPase